jgi:hypothetical protein
MATPSAPPPPALSVQLRLIFPRARDDHTALESVSRAWVCGSEIGQAQAWRGSVFFFVELMVGRKKRKSRKGKNHSRRLDCRKKKAAMPSIAERKKQRCLPRLGVLHSHLFERSCLSHPNRIVV